MFSIKHWRSLWSSEKKLRLDNNLPGERLISKIVDPYNAINIENAFKKSCGRQLPPERALSLMIDTNLSKQVYQAIRDVALEYGHDFLPAYNEVRFLNK